MFSAKNFRNFFKNPEILSLFVKDLKKEIKNLSLFDSKAVLSRLQWDDISLASCGKVIPWHLICLMETNLKLDD